MLSASAQVCVRAASQSDAAPLAAIHARSWRHAYTGIIPWRQLDTMIRRRGPKWWTDATQANGGLLALEVAGELAGYASFGPARSPHLAEGEIYELYLDPVYQGLGLGERLFEACRAALDRQKRDGLVVWVLADNHPAIAFYWGRGGRPHAQAYDHASGARLPKIGLVWP